MENNSNSGVIYQGKIPNRVKYCFAFGALGKDLIYGMIATFSMIYFTDIIKVAPAFIGSMFFVAKLWDAFNDLFISMLPQILDLFRKKTSVSAEFRRIMR